MVWEWGHDQTGAARWVLWPSLADRHVTAPWAGQGDLRLSSHVTAVRPGGASTRLRGRASGVLPAARGWSCYRLVYTESWTRAISSLGAGRSCAGHRRVLGRGRAEGGFGRGHVTRRAMCSDSDPGRLVSVCYCSYDEAWSRRGHGGGVPWGHTCVVIAR